MTRAQRWTMVAVVVGSGIVFLDTSVVNLALPRMAEELPSRLFAPLEAQSYVAGGYFVTLSALLILAGALTDRYGRRRMFALGLAGFGATSLLCGLAPTMELLIVFRVLHGAAGALVVPGSLSIITANFQGEEQGRAFGIWAGASALTTLLGPFVGGVLVDSVSWRAVFFLNLPFLVLAYLATVRHVAESRDEQAAGRVDWLGSVVVVVAVAGLAFGTIRGQQTGWQGPEAFVSLAAGAVAAVLFPVLTLRSANPLVPLPAVTAKPGRGIDPTPGNPRADATPTQVRPVASAVIALVRVDGVRPRAAPARRRADRRNIIQHRREHRGVGDVGGGHHGGQRQPTAVADQVELASRFATIDWICAHVVPAFGPHAHGVHAGPRPVQLLSSPSRSSTLRWSCRARGRQRGLSWRGILPDLPKGAKRRLRATGAGRPARPTMG